MDAGRVDENEQEYAPSGVFQASGNGRSELSYPDPQKLVDDYAGTGQPANNVAPGQPGYRERVNFGKVIGNYVDPVTGEKTPTTNGIIHYSKDGVHIVPGRP
ncbi:polymorphic toxin type 50 domain-containing protein [Burkholderia metallica]